MSQQKSFSRKVFMGTAFFMLLFTAAFDAGLFFGFDRISENGALNQDMFLKMVVPASAGLWILFTILIWAAVKSSAKILTTMEEKPEKEKTSAEMKKIEENKNKRVFLHLLSVLQRDARLMDFFFEKLDQFEDAQIGAAVRNIHENSFKTMSKYLSPKPVIENDEGEAVTIEKGFDPAAVKLTGNVTGEPPFKGILRHKGWQAGDFDLPVLSDRENSLLISPAEVEIK